MSHIRQQFVAALSLPALVLTGCYVVPVAPDGTPLYPVVSVPAPAVAVPAPYADGSRPPVPPAAPPGVLAARLYPSNELAAQHGVITGTVTNLTTGRGRFHLEYRGEVLVGEATRVSGDQRRGVASAYGTQGTFMSCDYRMTTPQQGTGSCTLSNGARYAVHLGS